MDEKLASDAQRTSEKKVCLESVTKDGWHFHKCKKPARYAVKLSLKAEPIYRCGIHAKRYKRFGLEVKPL